MNEEELSDEAIAEAFRVLQAMADLHADLEATGPLDTALIEALAANAQQVAAMLGELL